jgi:hypothetical protein
MRQMLSVPKHEVGGDRCLVTGHAHHVPLTPKSLRSTVACVLNRTAPSSRAVTFVCSGNAVVVPLTVSCARRSTMSSSGDFGAGDEHADVGEFCYFEIVSGTQVFVALAHSGVQRRGIDVGATENRLGVRDLAVTPELFEVPPTGASPTMSCS